jgi:hypothetical protein
LPKDLRTTRPSRFVAVVVPRQFCDSLVDRLLHRKIPPRRFFLRPSVPPSLPPSESLESNSRRTKIHQRQWKAQE